MINALFCARKLNVTVLFVASYSISEYAGHIRNNVNVDSANRYEYRLPIRFRTNYFIGYTTYRAIITTHKLSKCRYTKILVEVSTSQNGIIP